MRRTVLVFRSSIFSMLLCAAGGVRADVTIQVKATNGSTGRADVQTSYYAASKARFDWGHYAHIVDYANGRSSLIDTSAKTRADVVWSGFAKDQVPSAQSGAGKVPPIVKAVTTGKKKTIDGRPAQQIVIYVDGRKIVESWHASSLEPKEVLDFFSYAVSSMGTFFPPESLELFRQMKNLGVAVRVSHLADGMNLEMQSIKSTPIDESLFTPPTDYTVVDPEVMFTSIVGGQP